MVITKKKTKLCKFFVYIFIITKIILHLQSRRSENSWEPIHVTATTDPYLSHALVEL